MFGRFLSFLGFIPGLSGLSGLAGYSSGMGGGSGGEDGLDADGEAAVSFTPGKALASADSEETPDSRRERITDRDLVWPGKVETIQISNPEPIAYRFDLTVTDLNPAFYIRRPPQGGVPQREGGVLLQPGDGASFEVVFVPPPAGEKLKTRTFSFVLTCFDPRRSGDPGEIVQDLPLRWVGLPTESDLQITAAPPVIVTRPWRREAKFAVRFANKSFLPPTVGMTILRAPTKDALEREAETVGTIEQSLAARTPGVWQCLLPPSSRRGSYYATVRGAAQAADSVSTPLALPRPVLVRYVPWLRMGRDWAFLLGTLGLLFFLIWGIPTKKHPVIAVQLAFGGLKPGQPPQGASLRDLNPTMTLLDGDNTPLADQPTITGSFNDSQQLVFKEPDRWYGYHWPFGWSWQKRSHQRYQLSLVPKEGKEAEFNSYIFPAMSKTADLSIAQVRSLASDWKVSQTITVAQSPGTHVLINVGDLGGLKSKTVNSLTINYVLGGQLYSRIYPLYSDGDKGYKQVSLDLTDQVPQGKSVLVTLRATALGVQSLDSGGHITVQGQQGDFIFPDKLTFPEHLPLTSEQIKKAQTAEAQAKAKQDAADEKKQALEAAARAKVAASPSKPEPGGAGQFAAITPPVHSAPNSPPHPVNPAGHGGMTPVAGNKGTLPDFGHKQNLIPLHSTVPVPTPMSFRPTPVTPPPPTLPPTPEGLRAENAGPGRIYVHWSPVSGATKYILYRSDEQGRDRGDQFLPAYETSFSDTGLTPGSIYNYRIQSKNSVGRSPLEGSKVASLRATPPPEKVPATVMLTLSHKGKDVQATLDFTNVSSQTTVYLDKVSACAGGKIGDNVFTILEDGQPVEFKGKLSHRPDDPSDSQFIQLLPGGTHQEKVVLNHSYRLSSGAHSYSVTYSAPNVYRKRLQNITLPSNAASLDTPQ